jgi:hypothetical protein
MLHLYASEAGQGITMPRCTRVPRQPCLACKGHGSSRTHASFPLVPIQPGFFSNNELSFIGRRLIHVGMPDDLSVGNREASLAGQDIRRLRTTRHE